MRDKLLTYAVLASIGVHLVLLGLVGKTSAAKPITVDQLKVVRVDLVKEPDHALVQDKPQAPKPEVEQAKPEVPYVPPVAKMLDRAHQPKPEPHQPLPVPTRTKVPTSTRPERTVMAKLPGDPGGALRGVTAPNGEDLGRAAAGNTPVGWAPGPDGGHGSGSGTGVGVGKPDPVPDAHPGPGTAPAPAPPPPAPKMVTVTVCAVSGMLPGRHCEKKESKTFREGSEPGTACNVCKAPEPKHVSTLADRSEPELVRDIDPDLPEIEESGTYTVSIHYTVNTDGSVSDVELTESCGNAAIDRAILKAARKQMRFKPAVQDGKPRSVKGKRRIKVRV